MANLILSTTFLIIFNCINIGLSQIEQAYELILNHKDTSNGYFSISISQTGLENPSNTLANTYSIIGNFDETKRADYLIDGSYHFKLVFKYPDNTIDTLIWNQTTWITEVITSLIGFGSDLSLIPDQTDIAKIDTFYGLGLSDHPRTYLDGSSMYQPNWWSAVGVNKAWNNAIPGFRYKLANGQSLYIVNPNPKPLHDGLVYKTISSNQYKYDFVEKLGELRSVVLKQLQYMNDQEINVNAMIQRSERPDILIDSKKVALAEERSLMQQILTFGNMNKFLQNIILIENLFNALYCAQQRQLQQSARMRYGKNIEMYENTQKPLSNVNDIIGLFMAAKNARTPFKRFIDSVESKCKQNNINIFSSSGAKEKNMERGFFKSFYVYGAIYGDLAARQMTDVLRASIVFNNFNDLYHCFAIIEQMAKSNGGEGILRVKDRFNPNIMAFGYRDLLINMKCPESIIICEIQLHHQIFYQHKGISHNLVYKKARLFEVNGVNLAYNFADRYLRTDIGNVVYEYTNNGGNDLVKIRTSEIDPYELLTEWNLSQYGGVLIKDQGYDDVNFWKDLSASKLQAMRFLPGHIHKFTKLSAQL